MGSACLRQVKLSGIGRYEARGVHEVEAESGDWVWEVRPGPQPASGIVQSVQRTEPQVGL